jgi:replicative DNA helicase
MIEGERVSEVSEILAEDDFYDGRHRKIFAALVKLSEANAPVDFVSVGEELRSAGTFGEVGGVEYLVELSGAVSTSANALYHAKLLSDNGTLRRLIREATRMISRAYETPANEQEVQELLGESEQRMFEIARREDKAAADPISNAIKDTFRRIEAASHRQGLTGLTTGFLDLDQLLCGLNGGDLIIVASRPSMGKTALALNMIDQAATSQPEWMDRKPIVLLYSLEMGRQQVVSRMLCSRAGVDAHRLRTGRIRAQDRVLLTSAADELSNSSVFIDDSSALAVTSMRSRARRQKARGGLDLLVVDYLQLLTYPRSENRLQEISNISRSLKAIARELEIPVVALAQLSRQVELRDPPRPQLADLRESGSIEQDADVVLLLYRPEYYTKYKDKENEGLAEIICAKQRNGPTGTVRLQFFPPTMRFQNRAPSGAETFDINPQ